MPIHMPASRQIWNRIRFPQGHGLLVLFLLFAGVILWLAGCEEYAGSKEPGETFRIGYEEYAPYLYTDESGQPAGFDLELAQEVARRNRWKLEPVKIDWSKQRQLLENGTIDALWNGLKLTRERAEIYNCTKPYLSSAEVLLVRNDSKIKTMDDLAGKVVAVQSFTPTNREFTIGSLRPLAQRLKRLIPLGDSNDMRLRLNRGEVDAIVTDVRNALEYIKTHPEVRILSPALFETLNVIAFRRDDSGLRMQVIAALEQMWMDGTIEKITRKWFGQGIPPQTVALQEGLTDASQRQFSSDGLYLNEALRLVNRPTNPLIRYWPYGAGLLLVLGIAAILMFFREKRRKREMKLMSSLLRNMEERITIFGQDQNVLYSHFSHSEKEIWKRTEIRSLQDFPTSIRRDLEQKWRELRDNGEPFFYDYEAFGRWRRSRWALLPARNPFGKGAVICTSCDTTEQNKSFRSQTAINACLEVFLKRETAAVPLDQILQLVCRHLNAAHCYVMRVDRKTRFFSCRAEYAEDGTPPLFAGQSPLPFDPEAKWVQRLIRERFFCWMSPGSGRTADCYPVNANAKWNEFHSLPHMISGIFINGELWGSLGIFYRDMGKKKWDPVDHQFVQNITHMIELMLIREATHAELVRTATEAEDANRAKDYFLATMSHEIRTPLNVVIGLSEVLQNEHLDHQVKKDYLNSIVNAGKSLLDIINDILDLSKLEAGKMVFSLEETDFNLLAREVDAIFYQSRIAKGLQTVYELEDQPNIFIDKSRIRQILFNLLGNALKFTTAGTIRLRANFKRDTAAEGTLTFSIQDTGIGISEEDQKSLFQPFVQVNTLRGVHAANHGTGLGLAIVRRMVGRMGGSITLESQLKKGSTFTVRLPGLRYVERTQGKAATADFPAAEEGFRLNRKILLVDDVPMNLKVLTALLNGYGVESTVATSGKEALSFLTDHPTELILTDLWMPGMNGVELAKAVKLAHPGTKVVAITADVDGQKTFDMSIFDGIITKPVTREKLRPLANFSTGENL